MPPIWYGLWSCWGRQAPGRSDAQGLRSATCFGPPIADLVARDSALVHLVDQVPAYLARHWKGMFGYQILIEATRPDSVETLMKRTFTDWAHSTTRMEFPEPPEVSL